MKTFDIAVWHVNKIVKYNDEEIIAVQADEFRCPKAGEWYIETHLDHKPVACYAYQDLTQKFWIAQVGWVDSEGTFNDYYENFPKDKRQPFCVSMGSENDNICSHHFAQYLLNRYRQNPHYDDRNAITDWLRSIGCDLRTHNIEDKANVMQWLLHIQSYVYDERGALLHKRRVRDMMFVLPNNEAAIDSPEKYYAGIGAPEFIHHMYGKHVLFAMTKDMQNLTAEHDFIYEIAPDTMCVMLQDGKLHLKYRRIHGGRVLCSIIGEDRMEDVFSREEIRANGYDV